MIARFVGQLFELDATAPDVVRVRLAMRADQLGRVIHLCSFTGAGDPREFGVRIVTRDQPGLAWRAWLHGLSIERDGKSKVQLLLPLGFELDVLARLVKQNVVVEAKDDE